MKDIKEILKLADDLGIDYELNSETPGFFTQDSDGNEKEISLEEILLIEP